MELQRDLKINFVEFQLEIFGPLMVFKLVILQKDCLFFEATQIMVIEVMIKLNFQIMMLI